jgi:uncharacterized protein (TIGR02444 family)
VTAVASSRAKPASSSNPFWAYSLRLYRRPGVAPACLMLQERLGLDVNVLLFCVWTASRGLALSPRTIAAAADISMMWSANVVQPLRGVRRFLKPMQLPAFRGQVARAELGAEKLEQMLLLGLLPQVPASPTPKAGSQLAVRHLQQYFKRAKLRPKPVDIAPLLQILTVAFPAASQQQLRRVLGAA